MGIYNNDHAGVNGVGDEDLDVYIRKLCYEPSDWVVDPSDFEFSMNMTAVLYTQPTAVVTDTSADIYDMVGVFVGDELRGVATVEYYLHWNRYLIFIRMKYF